MFLVHQPELENYRVYCRNGVLAFGFVVITETASLRKKQSLKQFIVFPGEFRFFN